jgi:hypothetical protein
MGEVLSEQQRALLEASHRAAMVSERRLAYVLTPSGSTRRAEEDCWHG